jgi:hypothetical protein
MLRLATTAVTLRALESTGRNEQRAMLDAANQATTV